VNVLVLGGDGFCGWPTSLHLCACGYNVTVVDNLSRRNIDNELEARSLTPIAPMGRRVETWREVDGRGRLSWVNMDIATEYERLHRLIAEASPHAVVHFAEQRAAPYSMKSAAHKRYTVTNNVNGTNNLLAALVESGVDAHVVHLGTMGVYGYGTAGMKIPEGYLPVTLPNGAEAEILHPANPGSVYHMTKCVDQLLFAYYAKNDGVRVTDLHQGIVWGTQTPETAKHDDLINRYDYDGDYGTVLNRFLMQAVVGHPLTVHGTGGQTRAFIHIRDTVRCVELALQSPPVRGERVRIMNQMTETHRVIDLAQIVAQITGADVAFTPNPRNEDAENDLDVENHNLLDLGLQPTTLEEGLLEEVTEIVGRYRDRCDLSKIACRSTWTRQQMPGVVSLAP
jgi:UDP-sulfoquinovose synthase